MCTHWRDESRAGFLVGRNSCTNPVVEMFRGSLACLSALALRWSLMLTAVQGRWDSGEPRRPSGSGDNLSHSNCCTVFGAFRNESERFGSNMTRAMQPLPLLLDGGVMCSPASIHERSTSTHDQSTRRSRHRLPSKPRRIVASLYEFGAVSYGLAKVREAVHATLRPVTL